MSVTGSFHGLKNVFTNSPLSAPPAHSEVLQTKHNFSEPEQLHCGVAVGLRSSPPNTSAVLMPNVFTTSLCSPELVTASFFLPLMN